MGFYTMIYEDAKTQAIRDMKSVIARLSDDVADMEEGDEELSYLSFSVDYATRTMKEIMEDFLVAYAKDVAMDELMEDTVSGRNSYTEQLRLKKKDDLKEFADYLWNREGMLECTYAQLLKGVEEAWDEASKTWFDVPNWDAVVELMDDDLREQVHAELSPCSEAEFLARYSELHEQKYGEPFEIN